MLKNIVRFICGYYRIKISGVSCEKTLSHFINKDYKIKNIIKLSPDEFTFDCYPVVYKKILHSGNNSFDIDIIKNYGFPFLLKRYKHRYGLFIGFALFVLFFYIISLFVWDIQVTGNETIPTQQILTLLESQGFEKGKLKKSYDIKNIENGFLSKTDNISWVSINLKGTVAFVEVREKTEVIKKLDSSKPSNIYASRDGVIASIRSYMGYNAVNVGDTVTAGDVIVSGEYTDKYGVEYKLHSYAEVMAYTTHTYSVTVPFKTTEEQFTGKSKKYYTIKFTRFDIPLYFKENILYNTYSKNKSNIKFNLSRNFVLPFSLQKTTYSETQKITFFKSKDVALSEAYERLDDIQNNLIGIDILNKTYDITETKDDITVKVILDCYEDIGIEKEIN